jgi:hypothetical protein
LKKLYTLQFTQAALSGDAARVGRSWLIAVFFFLGLVACLAKGGDAAPSPNPDFKRLYSELRALFHRYYPSVTSNILNDEIHFEDNTRIFLIHRPLKTGEWQDASETRGPKRGGILCDIHFVKGRYAGAAAVPQTFDERYFKVLLLASYSAKQDAHLLVRLSFPDDAKEAFLKVFTESVNRFAE